MDVHSRKGLWRAAFLAVAATSLAYTLHFGGNWSDRKTELVGILDGTISMKEIPAALVFPLAILLGCALAAEVLTFIVSSSFSWLRQSGDDKAMFSANWFPHREKEQDEFLLEFLATTYSRMPLPDLEPPDGIEAALHHRSERTSSRRTMHIMRRVLSSGDALECGRSNSFPAETKIPGIGRRTVTLPLPEQFSKARSTDDERAEGPGDDPRLERFTDLVNHFPYWNFDMFLVKEATTQPLVFVGYSCLERCGSVDLDKLRLVNFLRAVEDNYNRVPYHNSLHGAAVGRLIFSLCKTAGLGRRLPEAMQFALVLAGLVHDVSHPGLTATFLSRSQDEVTLKYNDQSPLENMHLAVTFGLLAAEENQFLDEDMIMSIRGVLIRTVLSTDMAKHSELIARLDALIENHNSKGQALCPWYWPSSPPGYYSPEEKQVWEGKMQQEFIMEVFLHAADIGTPALPFEQFQKWNLLVREEFHAQGDREVAEFGLLISPPGGFNRSASPLALHKFDRFFLRYLSLPTFEKLHELSMINSKTCVACGVDLSLCLNNLRRNVERWDAMTPEESGS